MQCKAGDVIASKGRTGNPDRHTAQHTQLQCGQALTDCILPTHEQLFPFNGQPKLLPCAADWYTNSPNHSTPGTDNNGNAYVPKSCRALPQFRTNKQNTIPETCWAIKEGVCPHM